MVWNFVVRDNSSLIIDKIERAFFIGGAELILFNNTVISNIISSNDPGAVLYSVNYLVNNMTVCL
jgi:hypothetical protein